MRTTHTSKSHSRGGSHLSQEKDTKREAYATNAEGELLPTLITLLMMRRTLTIDRGQGLPLTSLSHMMKTTAMNAEIEIHPREAWEMTL